MTHQPHTGHCAVIQDALEDFWLNTDPREAFNTHTVADLVEDYLTQAGYQITPDIPRNHRMPTRRAITGAVLVALLCAASTLGTAIRHEWGWTTAGALITGALTREAIRALNHRRQDRP